MRLPAKAGTSTYSPRMIDPRHVSDENVGHVPGAVRGTSLPVAPAGLIPMARLLLGLLLAASLADQAFAQLAISAVTPSAVAPGKTTEIPLAGPNLPDPLAVWTSFPAQVELLPVEPNQRKLNSDRATWHLPK